MTRVKLLPLALAFALVSPSVAVGAPAKTAAPEPVAEGFLAWRGVEKENYLGGRELTASDLRHRFVVVVEFDGAKAVEQLSQLGILSRQSGLTSAMYNGGFVWETTDIPRDCMVVYSCVKDVNRAVIGEALNPTDPKKRSEDVRMIALSRSPVYAGVTFPEAPANDGKLPFVYAVGPDGKVLFSEAVDPKLAAFKVCTPLAQKLKKAKEDYAKTNPPEWRPFYGTESDAKGFPALEKALAKMKPLKVAEQELLKGVESKDAAVARKAQVLLDAVRQTRGEYIERIIAMTRQCPHRALYDLAELLRYWPDAKKQVELYAQKLKANVVMAPLVPIYADLRTWTKSDFTCRPADAKKIVQRLEKYRKELAALKESPKVEVQNGAIRLESMVDEAMAKFAGEGGK